MVHAQQVALTSLGVALALCGAVHASAASLLGQTITGLIQITGDDDAGFQTFDVFSGPVAVGSGYSNTFDVFRQYTRGGLTGASNQLDGVITLNVAADTITVLFNGQTQGVRLTSSFSGITGPIVGVSQVASGSPAGILADPQSSFTNSSVRLSVLYLGYEPGVEASQTATLSFAPGPPNTVPEPQTWSLLLAGLGFAGAAVRRRNVRAASARKAWHVAQSATQATA